MSYKTAIITGAGRGIGKSIAVGLAKLNYKTILISKNLANLEQTKNLILKEIENEKIVPDIFPIDLKDVYNLENRIKKIISRYDSIDIVVNNAGIYIPGSLDCTLDDFAEIQNINLFAPFILVKAIVEKMKSQKSGYIFNISSRAGKIGFARTGVYSASKFALAGFSESLYRELTEYGIKVTTICLGWVNTDMAYEANTPIQSSEMIQPEDIFKTINYLLTLSKSVAIKEIVIESGKSLEY